MKPEDLLKVWSAPDNTRLTAQQYSVRLPLHVAARIAALCEMYPRRTRTDMISDLLSTALDQVESGFPFVKGRDTGFTEDDGAPVYEDAGPGARFRSLTEKHMKELEAQQEKEEVAPGRPSPGQAKKRKGRK
jgi:hypothetical protein